MIDFCPPLESGTVILHPLKRKHAEALFSIVSDGELWQYIDGSPPASVAELRQRYASLETRMNPDQSEYWLNWAIEKKDDSRLIGYVQATVERSLACAQIAYVLGVRFRGQFLAFDAVSLMIEFLRSIGVQRFSATVDSENLRSIRLLKRLGFYQSQARDPRNLEFTASA
ncbi:MAG TPA: GNAT family N-acetyltransferase [Candidatus Rubrimentiphilum sp.]|nr:GNAT family N-acetyltransferase [Candidatus Rubrimentiphilum sp.]